MIAYHNYLTILIVALISFLIGSTIHRYSHPKDIFSFYRVFVSWAFDKIFKSPSSKKRFSFILKPLLDCTECFCGWISIPMFFDIFSFDKNAPIVFISHLILTVILTMYITRKLE